MMLDPVEDTHKGNARAALIHKYEGLRIEARDGSAPRGPRQRVLLARGYSPFFRVQSTARIARYMVGTLTRTPWVCSHV